MGKYLRKLEAKRQARRKGCEEARREASRKNKAIPVELAFKMPGSGKLSKG